MQTIDADAMELRPATESERATERANHAHRRIREAEARDRDQMDRDRKERAALLRTFKWVRERLAGRTFTDMSALEAYAFAQVVEHLGGEQPTEAQRSRITAALALWGALKDVPMVSTERVA